MIDIGKRVFGSGPVPAYGAHGDTDMRAAKALFRAIETGGMMGFKNRWWASKRTYAHQWDVVLLSALLTRTGIAGAYARSRNVTALKNPPRALALSARAERGLWIFFAISG